MTNKNNPYTSLASNSKYVLFVNSLEPPHKEIPLDHYYYKTGFSGNNTYFYRLHRIIYVQKIEGVDITHELLDWRAIDVQPNCIEAFKQLCDSMKSIKNFLREPTQV